jgi:hypothetical protein
MPYELRYSASSPRRMPLLTWRASSVALQKIDPADADVAALLRRAREEPLILQSEEAGDFAVLPLDEEVIDLLLERNPGLIEQCRQIRAAMQEGRFLTHQQMLAALEGETTANP